MWAPPYELVKGWQAYHKFLGFTFFSPTGIFRPYNNIEETQQTSWKVF